MTIAYNSSGVQHLYPYFTPIMHIVHTDNKIKKERALSAIPRDLAFEFDKEVHLVRKLLTNADLDASGLIQSTVYDQVISGATPEHVMRKVLPVIRMTSGEVTIPVVKNRRYARRYAEGAEVPIVSDDYTACDLKAYYIPERPLISKAAIADQKWDVVGIALRNTGEVLENTLNRDALEVVANNVGSTISGAGSAASILDVIINARNNLRKAKFKPDVSVISSDVEALILKELRLPGLTSSSTLLTPTIREAAIPRMYGLDFFVADEIFEKSASGTWGFSSAGEVGAVMWSSRHGTQLGMRQDIGIERFNDPTRLMEGMISSMRIAPGFPEGNKACAVKITY